MKRRCSTNLGAEINACKQLETAGNRVAAFSKLDLPGKWSARNAFQSRKEAVPHNLDEVIDARIPFLPALERGGHVENTCAKGNAAQAEVREVGTSAEPPHIMEMNDTRAGSTP